MTLQDELPLLSTAFRHTTGGLASVDRVLRGRNLVAPPVSFGRNWRNVFNLDFEAMKAWRIRLERNGVILPDLSLKVRAVGQCSSSDVQGHLTKFDYGLRLETSDGSVLPSLGAAGETLLAVDEHSKVIAVVPGAWPATSAIYAAPVWTF